MEVVENSSLSALFNNQKFKATGANAVAMQSSFIAELDMSVNAAEVANNTFEEKPIEPSKNDKPVINEEASSSEKEDLEGSVKEAKEAKENKQTKNQDETNVANETPYEQNVDNKKTTDKKIDSAKIDNTLENANANEVAGQDVGDEISGIKARDIKNEGGQDGIKADKKTSQEISQNQTIVPEAEASKNIEVSPQVVQVAQAQVATQDGALQETEAATEDYAIAKTQSSHTESVFGGESGELIELAETQQAQKSPEVKAQEQAIAQKVANPDAKINIEVEVEQAGFDFSAPKVVIADTPAKTELKTQEATPQATLGQTTTPQAIAPDATKAIAGNVQNINTQTADVANKAQTNNIAPIGLEVANKTSKFNEAANTQKTANNDNLKATSKEVIDQIKVNITKSAVKGVDVIDIKLKPEDLGELSIKIELKKEDGSANIVISASNKETLELLQKDAANLQKAFEDAGYKMGENSLSFSEQGQEQKQENAQKQARMNFMADALSEQQEEETIYQGNAALNIKV